MIGLHRRISAGLSLAVLAAGVAMTVGAGPAAAATCPPNSYWEAEIRRCIYDGPPPTTTPVPIPASVTNQSVGNVTDTAATLSWQDNSTNEDSFYVWRQRFLSPGVSERTRIVLPAYTGTGARTWTDTGLRPLTQYRWDVIAVLNGEGGTNGFGAMAWTLGPAIPADTPAADRITAFRDSRVYGVFPHVDKAALISDLVATVKNPVNAVNQGNTGLCGPAAIQVELARRNPARFVDIVRSIYETGQFQSGGTTYAASAELKASPVRAGITSADWLFMATVRDAGNAFMRITAQTEATSLAYASMPWEVATWMRTILGLGTVDTYGQNSYYSMDQIVTATAGKLASGGVMFLLVDSSLVGNSPGFVNYPNHYVDLVRWSPAPPNTTFDVVTWGGVRTQTVASADFNAKTFSVFVGS